MSDTDDLKQPSAADVLEEARRRQQETRIETERDRAGLVIAADRVILWVSKRWLAVFNSFALVYVGLPFLAPALMHLGSTTAASLIYAVYSPLCHQLPQRSFFLFGPRLVYRLPELMAMVGDEVTGAFSSSFIGNQAVGYKVAFCQRDAAIYGAIFLFGLLYGLLRRRWDIRPLPWWAYILVGLVPMGLDGGYQLMSYLLPLLIPGVSVQPYETTPLMRVVTGTFFGCATVWLAYPHLQASMEEVRASLESRLG